jgi:pilus assembly protein Flp/PilA
MARAVMGFLRDEDGATAIEYGLIAALVAVTAIAGFTALGNGLFNLFGSAEQGVVPVLEGAVGNT